MPSAATARSSRWQTRPSVGGDIGVEALGFVPSRVGRGAAVYFSDLGAPGSPTEGDDSLLAYGARTSRARPFAAVSYWRRWREAG